MQHLIPTLQNALAQVTKGKITTALALLLAENAFAQDTDFLHLSARWNALQKEKHEGVIKDSAHLESGIERTLIETIQAHIKEIEAQPLPYFPTINPVLWDKEGFLWGRKTELMDIEAAYQKGKNVVLLHGIGGIGKTTLLLAYSNRAEAKQRFPTRIWIEVQEQNVEQAQETDVLMQSLIAYFREPLNLVGKSNAEQQAAITQYLYRLGKQGLLILDNFNAQASLQKSLKWLQALPVSVLISSRTEVLGITHFLIQPLSKEASLAAFRAFNTTPYSSESLSSLLAALQHHPLLIELCAKHLLKKRSLQLPTLIEAASKADLSCLTTTHFHVKREDYIEKSIAAFLLDIFPLTQLTVAEQQILRYFTLLSARVYSLDALTEIFVLPNELYGSLSDSRNEPNDLSSSFRISLNEQEKSSNLLNDNQTELKGVYGSLSDSRNEPYTPFNDIALDELLSDLKSLGWLEESVAENTDHPVFMYQCHPLIRYATKQQLQPDAENCKAYFKALAKSTGYDAHKNPITQSEFLPDLLVALTYLKEEDVLKVDVYGSIKYLYEVIGDYQQALKYGLLYVGLAEKLYGENDTQLATAYNNLAITYEKLGDYTQALSYAQKDIAICEKVLGAEHPDLAASYNNIAVTYRKLGDYTQALSYAQKAIAIREKVLGAEHPELATSYNNIAITYKNLGDYTQALSYAQKAIAIREKVLGAEHPDLATSYNNIAVTYKKLGDYTQALSYDKKAIAIFEKVLGTEHPSLATSYANIAVTYKKLGDYTQALSYAQKAIAIREKVLGAEHPDLATSYNNIAITYYYLSDFENALSFSKKAVLIDRKVHQENHPLRKSHLNIMKDLLAQAKGKVREELLAEYEALMS